MSRSRKRRFGGFVFLLLLVAVMAAGAWLYQRYRSFADAPLAGVSTGQTVVVSSGDSLPKVLAKLREAGIQTGQTVEWRALAREMGAAGHIQVGEYELTASTTPRELLSAMRDGRVVQGGYIYRRGGDNRLLGRVEVESVHGGPEHLHERLTAVLHPADGGPAERVDGRVLAMVPLRNRRAGVTTRIAEGLTEWRWGGRTGYGWSEYLDHVD